MERDLRARFRRRTAFACVRIGSKSCNRKRARRSRSTGAFRRVRSAFWLAVRIRRGTAAGMSDFGRRPNHETPWWVPTDATFQIRIRIAPDSRQLTVPAVAGALLKSVRFYSEKRRWHFTIFLLMPDHLHALLAFPADQCMSDVVGDWKRWHTLHSGVEWQENFFDHRIRTDAEWEEKFRYIRNNPIVKGLCARPADWPWQSLGTDDESRPLDAARFDR